MLAMIPTMVPKETIMTEIEKLTALRDKLVARRRSLVERLREARPEQLTGESIMRIQSAVEAVSRAIEDEIRAEPTHDARRRAVPVS
jgi:hypothetical protein